MAKMIDEITHADRETIEESDVSGIISRYSSDIARFLEFISTANRTGILDLLESVMTHRMDIVDILTAELKDSRNGRFIRNILTFYTMLSGIDPEALDYFMENAVSSFGNPEYIKSAQKGGLSKLLFDIRDPEVIAGIKVILSLMKGMAKVRTQ
ncbi:MAG: hypothetical protein AAE977_03385 [Thermoplasmataceae archaeon]|jgi:uncharacterized protein YjgD (DUF1641 family)